MDLDFHEVPLPSDEALRKEQARYARKVAENEGKPWISSDDSKEEEGEGTRNTNHSPPEEHHSSIFCSEITREESEYQAKEFLAMPENARKEADNEGKPWISSDIDDKEEEGEGTMNTIHSPQKQHRSNTFCLEITQEESEYRAKELLAWRDDLLTKKITCTSCGKDLRRLVLEGRGVFTHPMLAVLTCEKCSSFYGDDSFSVDEDGSDKYCRWCGDGGSLYCCSFCSLAFCRKCLKRNLSRSALKDVESEDWKCLVCQPQPIWELRALCAAIQEYMNKNIVRGRKLLNKSSLQERCSQRKTLIKQSPCSVSSHSVHSGSEEQVKACKKVLKKEENCQLGSDKTISDQHVVPRKKTGRKRSSFSEDIRSPKVSRRKTVKDSGDDMSSVRSNNRTSHNSCSEPHDRGNGSVDGSRKGRSKKHSGETQSPGKELQSISSAAGGDSLRVSRKSAKRACLWLQDACNDISKVSEFTSLQSHNLCTKEVNIINMTDLKNVTEFVSEIRFLIKCSVKNLLTVSKNLKSTYDSWLRKQLKRLTAGDQKVIVEGKEPELKRTECVREESIAVNKEKGRSSVVSCVNTESMNGSDVDMEDTSKIKTSRADQEEINSDNSESKAGQVGKTNVEDCSKCNTMLPDRKVYQMEVDDEIVQTVEHDTACDHYELQTKSRDRAEKILQSGDVLPSDMAEMMSESGDVLSSDRAEKISQSGDVLSSDKADKILQSGDDLSSDRAGRILESGGALSTVRAGTMSESVVVLSGDDTGVKLGRDDVLSEDRSGKKLESGDDLSRDRTGEILENGDVLSSDRAGMMLESGGDLSRDSAWTVLGSGGDLSREKEEKILESYDDLSKCRLEDKFETVDVLSKDSIEEKFESDHMLSKDRVEKKLEKVDVSSKDEAGKKLERDDVLSKYEAGKILLSDNALSEDETGKQSESSYLSKDKAGKKLESSDVLPKGRAGKRLESGDVLSEDEAGKMFESGDDLSKDKAQKKLEGSDVPSKGKVEKKLESGDFLSKDEAGKILENGDILAKYDAGKILESGDVLSQDEAGKILDSGDVLSQDEAGKILDSGDVLSQDEAGKMLESGDVLSQDEVGKMLERDGVLSKDRVEEKMEGGDVLSEDRAGNILETGDVPSKDDAGEMLESGGDPCEKLYNQGDVIKTMIGVKKEEHCSFIEQNTEDTLPDKDEAIVEHESSIMTSSSQYDDDVITAAIGSIDELETVKLNVSPKKDSESGSVTPVEDVKIVEELQESFQDEQVLEDKDSSDQLSESSVTSSGKRKSRTDEKIAQKRKRRRVEDTNNNNSTLDDAAKVLECSSDLCEKLDNQGDVIKTMNKYRVKKESGMISACQDDEEIKTTIDSIDDTKTMKLNVSVKDFESSGDAVEKCVNPVMSKCKQTLLKSYEDEKLHSVCFVLVEKMSGDDIGKSLLENVTPRKISKDSSNSDIERTLDEECEDGDAPRNQLQSGRNGRLRNLRSVKRGPVMKLEIKSDKKLQKRQRTSGTNGVKISESNTQSLVLNYHITSDFGDCMARWPVGKYSNGYCDLEMSYKELSDKIITLREKLAKT